MPPHGLFGISWGDLAAIAAVVGAVYGGANRLLHKFKASITEPLSGQLNRLSSSIDELTRQTERERKDFDRRLDEHDNALIKHDTEVEATDFYNRAQSVIGSRKQPRFWMIDVEADSNSGTLSSSVTAYMNKLNSLGIPDSKIVLYVSNALYPSVDTTRTMIWIPSYGANDGFRTLKFIIK